MSRVAEPHDDVAPDGKRRRVWNATLPVVTELERRVAHVMAVQIQQSDTIHPGRRKDLPVGEADLAIAVDS